MKLFHGACEDILKDIPDKSVDAVICDPPYGTLNGSRKDYVDDSKQHWDNIVDYTKVVPEIKRIVKKNACICIFDDMMNRHKTIAKLEDLGLCFKHELIWHKPSYIQPFMVNQKPAKDVEYMLMFSSQGERIKFYNSFDKIEKKIEFKYAYWCDSASDARNPKQIDFQEAKKKILEGDKEYIEHVRFGTTLKNFSSDRLYFTHACVGPTMKYFLKLLNSGEIFIEDDIFKRRISSNVNGKKTSSIIECDYIRSTNTVKLHPTQKPLELMKKLVSLYTKER